MKTTSIRCGAVLAAGLLAAAPASAAEEERTVLEGLPVRSVTIFKDGHAWVRHEGEVVLDAQGSARLDNLPAPMLGTFWSSGGSGKLRLVSATAGTEKTPSDPIDVADLPALLRANAGSAVRIVERPAGEGQPAKTWEGKLVARDPAVPLDRMVVVEHVDGFAAINVANILTADFHNEPALTYTVEEERNRLSLRFDAPAGELTNTTTASVSYVQKGLRWIPNYRVTIAPEGEKATVELQATIVNDLADLDKVAADLVVGVPSFAFKDQLDPMSLQEQLARVDAARGGGMQTYLSNAIMSQAAAGRFAETRGYEVAEDAPAPEVTGGEKNEDLYVFNVQNLSLRKGERMTLPVASFEVPTEVVHKLTLPYGPPPEVRAHWNSGNQDEFARLSEMPTAKSVLRMANTAKMPITTAPALIFNGDRIVAQGMTRYTPPGAELDLEMTTAVDIKVRVRDIETGRFPNDFSWRSEKMTRIEMAGEIELANRRDKPVRIEVRRHVLGKVGEADSGGTAVQLGGDWTGDTESLGERPPWWNWYSWPWWWYANNGSGLFEWETLTLQPGESKVLKQSWKYFWAG